ncbi:MAG: hypothetical protein AB7S80_05935 [Rhizobiaceae bacterium]
MQITITPLLRNALLLDALVSGAAAILMAAGSSLLAPLLELPAQLLLWVGIALGPFVVLLLAVARRAAASRLLLLGIVEINLAWVLASVGILVAGAVQPNLLGVAFVLAQAAAVAFFAALQWIGLGRAAQPA